MLSETAILEINDLLSLVESYLLTDNEIDYLNQIGENPTDICGYYDSTQLVLERRAKTDTTINNSLEALKDSAGIDGCTLTLAPEVVPSVDIPFFAGSI